MRKESNWVLGAVFASLVGAAWADTTLLPLTDDAWINANNPGANFGTADSLFVHSWGPKQGLVRFDAASIAGQSVSNAVLKLHLSDIAAPGTIGIYAITSSWSEATVTWNNRPPTEMTPANWRDVNVGDSGSLISFNVSDVAQQWADGSLADAGFLIVTSDSIKAYFDAKEVQGGIPASLEVDSGVAPTVEAIVLDLSDPENCVIDESGYYLLDRTWLLYPVNGNTPACGAVSITSGGVTLDMQGFKIEHQMEDTAVVFIDTPYSVTLRNGILNGVFVAIEDTVGSESYAVTLDNIRASGAVRLKNRLANVIGGKFGALLDPSLSAGEGSRVESATFSCDEDACLSVRGSSLVRNCTFSVADWVPSIALSGDNTTIVGNSLGSWIYLAGNDNVIARNFSSIGSRVEVRVGTRNVLDGNIGLSIDFESTGNFYSNNRVALPGGFSGTEGNVDWGGNVTY